ncbi:MAG TPA: PilN domain-containing protein [Vicinamibacterales bacterium]|jgi:type IV pilus assembly protein PilN
MIRINLLATERKKKKAAVAAGPQMTIVGIIVVLAAAVAFIGWRYWALNNDSAKLDADIQAAQAEKLRLDSIIKQVKQFETDKANLQQRVQLIEQLRAAQTGPVHLLDQVSRALPQMLWLSGMHQDPKTGDVILDGTTTTQTAVTEFANNLEATNYFKKSVDIVKTDARTIQQAPGTVYDFEIRAVFAPPSAKPATGATSAKTGG